MRVWRRRGPTRYITRPLPPPPLHLRPCEGGARAASQDVRNPRGNDRSGRGPDTNCGEHSGNTRGSSAERSERNRRDLSLIAALPRPADWLTRWAPVRRDTRVFLRFTIDAGVRLSWLASRRTSSDVRDDENDDDTTDRSVIGNEIKRELPGRRRSISSVSGRYTSVYQPRLVHRSPAAAG